MIRQFIKRFQFSSIRTRLLFWLLITALLPLILASAMIYNEMVGSRKALIYNTLEAVRDLKASELNRWIDERAMDVLTISANENLRTLGMPGTAGMGMRIPEVRAILKRYVRNYDAFDEIYIVDLRDNKVLVSSNGSVEGVISYRYGYSVDRSNSSKLFIGDIQQNVIDDHPFMLFSNPVYGPGMNRDAFGIVVIRINLDLTLYRLLLNRTGLGRTGETLIVSPEHVALNELLWHRDAPLKLKVSTEPASEALRGKTGIIEADDYRGKKVLAAYTYIPRTGWGFVAKQDLSEVYAPIHKLRNRIFLIVITVMTALLLAAFFIARSISAPIEKIQRGFEIIGRGDLGHRVGNERPDEIGKLSRIFDSMMENIRNITASRDELDREIAERKQLEKELLEAEDRERERIGRDLHDDLGQIFTGLAFKCLGLKNRLKAASDPAADDAAEIMSIADSAKKRLRQLVKGLLPVDAGSEGLMSALGQLARDTAVMSGVSCEFSCEGPVPVHEKSAVLNLYRIAQEAVTNAVRHAGADHVDITLNMESDKVVMTITDNGRGMGDVPVETGGMGIKTMKYRANLINAEFDIRQGVNGGAIVACCYDDKSMMEDRSHKDAGSGRPVYDI